MHHAGDQLHRLLDVLTMQGRPSRWLAMCIALGLVGAIWLSRDRDAANNSPSERATLPGPATQPGDSNPLQAKDHAGSQEHPSISMSPGLLLGFQSPPSAKIGEVFDVHLVIDGRDAIERIDLEIGYDPALLRARTTEELDYSRRTADERTFSINPLSEGRVAAMMVVGGDAWGPAYRMRAAVAQFEAVAPGSARIRISNIQVSDRAGRPIAWTASGQESAIVLN